MIKYIITYLITRGIHAIMFVLRGTKYFVQQTAADEVDWLIGWTQLADLTSFPFF